jgi:hypothetical protein
VNAAHVVVSHRYSHCASVDSSPVTSPRVALLVVSTSGRRTHRHACFAPPARVDPYLHLDRSCIALDARPEYPSLAHKLHRHGDDRVTIAMSARWRSCARRSRLLRSAQSGAHVRRTVTEGSEATLDTTVMFPHQEDAESALAARALPHILIPILLLLQLRLIFQSHRHTEERWRRRWR